MNKPIIKAFDFNRGKKRINLSLAIEDFQNLVTISNSLGITNPGTMALSMLVQEIRKEITKLPKNELPGQQNLFQKGKKNGKTRP